LLVNDSCFGVLKSYQVSAYGHSSDVDLRSPDFEALARGYGVTYRRIGSTGEAGGAVAEAVARLAEGSTLIELQAELKAPPQSI
ncbi:MAG: Thiamine pyrophosphate enzyme C-terminal binding domain, partial [Gaiellales bacterium]|nr:Thiamine pyrophosphate enzyme C-terminal binding domain [Gaiellales bacterium]